MSVIHVSNAIWYVAYGSNLLEARFLAYLAGCGDGPASVSYTHLRAHETDS